MVFLQTKENYDAWSGTGTINNHGYLVLFCLWWTALMFSRRTTNMQTKSVNTGLRQNIECFVQLFRRYSLGLAGLTDHLEKLPR